MAGDPRIRGEHEDKRYADWDRAGSSPHTRGARRNQNRRRLARQIIPAYAGSTRSRLKSGQKVTNHPRIRGEHKYWATRWAAPEGSSPHTRGARRPDRRRYPDDRIIPAYAGSTQAGASLRMVTTDHPRIRGEHTTFIPEIEVPDGSSPHTRGARTYTTTQGR